MKTSFLPIKQKKLLFKSSNLLAIKEYNTALIYKLQCNISTEYYKDRNSTISTSIISSSSSHSPTSLQSEINALKKDNNILQSRITNIKLSQQALLSSRTSFLKSSHSSHKGHRLRKQLNKAHATYRKFNTLFNARHSLFYTNVANFMDMELQHQRNNLITLEKDKLSSTNKVHNFTAKSLPPDTTSLLNKGTNFIPTTSASNTSSLGCTILSEVNNALCSIISKKNTPSKSSKSSHRYKPYHSHSRPLKLLQQEQSRPNFNLYLIDYVQNTFSYTKEFLKPNLLRSIYNPRLANITPHTASHITDLQNNNDVILTMTDKNMGWALVPISWFSTEYKRHFSDISTYKRIDNFDLTQTVTNSNTLLRKLKQRFSTINSNHNNLLDPI